MDAYLRRGTELEIRLTLAVMYQSTLADCGFDKCCDYDASLMVRSPLPE